MCCAKELAQYLAMTQNVYVFSYRSPLDLVLLVGACVLLGLSSVRGSLSRDADAFITVNRWCQQVPLYVRLNCIRRRYRTFDGTCNNLCNVTKGAAETGFARFLPAAFQNGLGPRFKSSSGVPLKNARTISRNVFLSTSEDVGGVAPPFSHATMTWGQILDHDITLTESSETPGCGTDNEPCPTNVPGCISIPISQANPDDRLKNNQSARCIPLSRSAQRNDGEEVGFLLLKVTSIILFCFLVLSKWFEIHENR